MKLIFLIGILLPATLGASCTDERDPDFSLAVSQGDYAMAFQIVARELRLSTPETRAFQIVQGFSRSHGDRNGQADPEAMRLRLDPALFIEGKSGACQGVAHELAHWRQFRRDRQALHRYYSTHPVPEPGWQDCEHQVLGRPDPVRAEEEAYACLQDNDLAAHAAADDIEAVLAQVPYADGGRLRDDDLSYLEQNLTLWSAHQTQISDRSNESYYLPELKKADIRAFCRGVVSVRSRLASTLASDRAWSFYCRKR